MASAKYWRLRCAATFTDDAGDTFWLEIATIELRNAGGTDLAPTYNNVSGTNTNGVQYPTLAIDGSSSTFWQTESGGINGGTSDFDIDFDNAIDVQTIVIRNGPNTAGRAPTTVQIYTSSDGSSYTLLDTWTPAAWTTTGQPQTRTLPSPLLNASVTAAATTSGALTVQHTLRGSVTASATTSGNLSAAGPSSAVSSQYWRLLIYAGNQYSDQYYARLSAVRLLLANSTNVALSPATATTTGYNAANAIDNNTATAWESLSSYDAPTLTTLNIDLQSAQSIASVVIVNDADGIYTAASPTRVDIQTSANGTDWTTNRVWITAPWTTTLQEQSISPASAPSTLSTGGAARAFVIVTGSATVNGVGATSDVYPFLWHTGMFSNGVITQGVGPMTASITATASVTGRLFAPVAHPLAASVSASVTITAALSGEGADKSVAASIIASATATATLRVPATLVASVAATARTGARLTVGTTTTATTTGKPDTVFGWPVYSDGASVSISGGTWRAALPLINALTRETARVARSTNLSAITFTVNLGAARTVGVMAIPNHSLSRDAAVRWRASDSEATLTSAPIYDSGEVAVCADGFLPAETYAAMPFTSAIVPADSVTAQFWRCDIKDSTNPAGYVDIGRVMLCAAMRPNIGISVGASFGFLTDTRRITMDSGASVYLRKPKRRTWRFSLDNRAPDEAFATTVPMLHDADISEPFVFVYDSRDNLSFLRSFSCTMQELGLLEWRQALYADTTFQLVEEL
jgi:hypothetical protein